MNEGGELCFGVLSLNGNNKTIYFSVCKIIIIENFLLHLRTCRKILLHVKTFKLIKNTPCFVPC